MNNNELRDKFRAYALDYLNTIALRMFELGLDEIDTEKLYLHANFHLKMFSIVVRGEIRNFVYDENSVLKETEEHTPLFMLIAIVNSKPEIDRLLDAEEDQINRLIQEIAEEQEINNNAGDRG